MCLATLFAGCKKEDSLKPTEVRNWFEIIPTENMDAVDQKIYDIWQEYGIGVFYNDVLGYEDRGQVDENGDPVYYYEILKPGYDLTSSANAASWVLLNFQDPEQKARILPMLELLENELLPIIKNSTINIPAVMITETMTVGGSAMNVYRGFSYMALSAQAFTGTPEVANQYRLDFVNQACAGTIGKYLDAFYEVPEKLLGRSDIWTTETGGFTGVYSGSAPGPPPAFNLVPGYASALINYNSDPSNPEYKAELEKTRPEVYGLYSLYLYWGVFHMVQKKSVDLNEFLTAVLSIPEDEFVLEKPYPNLILRYRMLKSALEEAGIDVDALHNS